MEDSEITPNEKDLNRGSIRSERYSQILRDRFKRAIDPDYLFLRMFLWGVIGWVASGIAHTQGMPDDQAGRFFKRMAMTGWVVTETAINTYWNRKNTIST